MASDPPTEITPLTAGSVNHTANADAQGEEETDGLLTIIVENIEEFTNDIIDGVQDVAGDVKEAVMDAAGDVQEAIVYEFQELADAFIEELHEADDEEDKYFFLEMGLMRNMSMLPGDMVDAAAMVPSAGSSCNILPSVPALRQRLPTLPEYGDDQIVLLNQKQESVNLDELEAELEAELVKVQANTPLSAYLLLFSAVVSLSAIGPLLDLQQGVGPTMKVYWRQTATALLMLAPAAWSVHKDGIPVMSYTQWIMMMLTAGSYSGMCFFFVWALEYTAVGNALIFSNSQALLLLVGKLFVGQRVTCIEGAGAFIAFSGAILCSRDSSQGSPTNSGDTTLWGDLFAILSALSGVTYLVFAKTLRSSMNLYVFMFMMMALGSLETLVIVAIVGEPLSFDRNRGTGAFGWLNVDEPDRFPLELVMVLVCNLFGTTGYVRAMHYFDNLVISVAALCEPVVAEFLAFGLGVGFLPGWKGWMGNALVACGTYAVVYRPPGKHMSSTSH